MNILITKVGGEAIELEDTPFASGGEGRVYRIISPKKYQNHCVKIYFDCTGLKRKGHRKVKERERKIAFMVENKPETLEGSTWKVCWPVDLVYDRGEFIGFIMPLAFSQSIELFELTNLKISQKLQREWSKFERGRSGGLKKRFKLNSNIALAVHNLHKSKKYVIVDMKPQNFLVALDGKISIIDVDTIQISDNENVLFSSKAVTPEYLPPESANINEGKINVCWDRFILSVMLYEVLYGIHPFTGAFLSPYDNISTLRNRIEYGLFPFGEKEELFKGIPVQHFSFRETPDRLQQLFLDALDSGLNVPSSRPSAEIWGQTFFDCVKNNTIIKEPLSSDTSEESNVKDTWQNRSILFATKNKGLLVGSAVVLFIVVGLISRIFSLSNDRDYYESKHNSQLDTSQKYENQISAMSNQISAMSNQIKGGEEEIEKLKEFISSFALMNPIEIKDIEFSSVKNGGEPIIDYGNRLYRSDMRYLKGKIYYDSYLEKEKEIEVHIKVFNTDGSLKENKKSLLGYTFSSYVNITGDYATDQTQELTGWGNSNSSTYDAGAYRYEIWYEGKCIGAETVRIYD